MLPHSLPGWACLALICHACLGLLVLWCSDLVPPNWPLTLASDPFLFLSAFCISETCCSHIAVQIQNCSWSIEGHLMDNIVYSHCNIQITNLLTGRTGIHSVPPDIVVPSVKVSKYFHAIWPIVSAPCFIPIIIASCLGPLGSPPNLMGQQEFSGLSFVVWFFWLVSIPH